MITRESGLSDWEGAAVVGALSAFAAPTLGAALLYVPVLGGLYGARRSAVVACWGVATRTAGAPEPPLMQKPFRLAHLVETVESVLHH